MISYANPFGKQAGAPEEESAHIHHLYVSICVLRGRQTKHLAERGVQSQVHYQGPCVNLRRDPEGLSANESQNEAVVSIPRNPQMTDADVEQVVTAVNSFRAV